MITLTSSLFWDVTESRLVASHHVLRKPFSPIFKGQPRRAKISFKLQWKPKMMQLWPWFEVPVLCSSWPNSTHFIGTCSPSSWWQCHNFLYLLVIFNGLICWLQILLLVYCFNFRTVCIQTSVTKSNTVKWATFSSPMVAACNQWPQTKIYDLVKWCVIIMVHSSWW